MSGEKTLWRYVQRNLKNRWDAQRHEDSISRGIPDVSYAIEGADGWIELKSLDQWPVRPGTPVHIRITPEQVAWLETRGDAGGGRCFVLLRVGREHLLVRWCRCRSLLRDTITQAEIRATAEVSWEVGIDWDKLLWHLMRGGE